MESLTLYSVSGSYSVPCRRILSAILVTLLFLPFQNCSDGKKRFSGDKGHVYGNGRPYGGKPYVNRDQVCDDQDVTAKIMVHSPSSAQMVRDNCRALNPVIELGAGEFAVDSVAETVTYANRVFRSADVGPVAVANRSVKSSSDSTSALSTVFSNKPKSGSSIVVYVLFDSVNPLNLLASEVSDTNGNIYREACSSVGPHPSGNFGALIFYSNNVRSEAPTFAVTIQASSLARFTVHAVEVSGLETSPSLDIFASASGAVFTPTVASTQTPSSAAQFVTGVFAVPGGMGGVNREPDQSPVEDSVCCGTGPYGAADYKIQNTPAAPPRFSWWHDAGSTPYRACLATFRGAAL